MTRPCMYSAPATGLMCFGVKNMTTDKAMRRSLVTTDVAFFSRRASAGPPGMLVVTSSVLMVKDFSGSIFQSCGSTL